MRGVAFWAAVAVVTAGCSGSTVPEAPAGLVELAPGIVVAADRGAVSVQVRDDAGLAVPQAHVQLTGTDHFARSDGTGRVLLVNVTAGAHTLRVERSGFHVLERAVQVNASELLDLRVHLLPTAGSYRPHVHDLWRGQVEHTLFDGEFDYQASRYDSDLAAGPTAPVFRTVVHPNRNESTSFALIPVSEEVDGRANLVFPGAERVEVTVTWDASASTLQEVGVAYSTPHSARKVLDLRPAGSTWSIPVGSQSDIGHQRFTLWDFYLYPGNELAQPTQWEPGLVVGPFYVKITAFRGDELPVDPEHPDFWKDRLRLVLMTASEPAYSEPSNPTGDRHRDKGHIRLEDRLVPPGTTRLTINHTWSYRTAEYELAGTPLDMDHVLTWRTADQHRYLTPLSEYRRSDGLPCGPRCMQYDIDVEAAWTDAYYQTRSLWVFLPSVAGYEDEEEYRPDPRPKDHYLEIIAWRTAS